MECNHEFKELGVVVLNGLGNTYYIISRCIKCKKCIRDELNFLNPSKTKEWKTNYKGVKDDCFI